MTPADRHDLLEEFFALVRGRSDAGAIEYGDRSFALDPDKLADEMEEEALDIAAWGFVLWCRIRDLKRAAQSMEREADMAQQYYVYGEHIVAEIRYNTGRCAVVETACQEVVESCGTPLVGTGDPSSVATCAGCLQMWNALHSVAAE